MRNEKIIKACDHAIEWLLYVLVFVLPFSKAIVSICIVSSIALWVLKRVAGYRADSCWGMLAETPLNKAILVYLLINIFSVIGSVDLGLSLRALFTKQIKFMLICFIAAETFSTHKRFRNVFIAIILSALIVTLDAVSQYFIGKDIIKGYPLLWRLSACFSSSNGFAGWLIMIIPILIGLVAREENSFLNARLKIAVSFLTVLMVACLIMAYSRGAWIGALLALILSMIYILRQKGFSWKKAVAGFCIVGIVVCLLFSKGFFHSVANLHFKSNETIKERIFSLKSVRIRAGLWSESFSIIKEYPLFGCGLNTYSKVAPQHKMSSSGGVYPHNSFLQMTAEIGLMGALSFFWIFIRFFKWGWRGLKERPDPLILGLLLGVLAALTHSVVDNNLFAFQLVILLWFVVGVAIGMIRTKV